MNDIQVFHYEGSQVRTISKTVNLVGAQMMYVMFGTPQFQKLPPTGRCG